MTDYRHAFERELARVAKIRADLQAERKALYAERQRSERLERENAELRAAFAALSDQRVKEAVDDMLDWVSGATSAPPRDAGARPSGSGRPDDRAA